MWVSYLSSLGTWVSYLSSLGTRVSHLSSLGTWVSYLSTFFATWVSYLSSFGLRVSHLQSVSTWVPRLNWTCVSLPSSLDPDRLTMTLFSPVCTGAFSVNRPFLAALSAQGTLCSTHQRSNISLYIYLHCTRSKNKQITLAIYMLELQL
jgi:hypothetical protein